MNVSLVKKPVTIAQLASYVLGREAITLADFNEAGLPFMSGCQICHESMGPYKSMPSKSGYTRCPDHIVDLGFYSPSEAWRLIFEDEEVAA